MLDCTTLKILKTSLLIFFYLLLQAEYFRQLLKPVT